MKLSPDAKKMMTVIGSAAIVFIMAGVIYYRSSAFLPFALGVVLGALLNILKVYMLDRSIDKSLDLDAKNAGNYMRLQYLLRFLLTGVVLMAAALTPFISLWGAAAGIITLQIAALVIRRA